MIMPYPRFALRLLAFADSFGAREELVGDVLEEISRGRSRLWLYQQLVGLFGLALTMRIRKHTRLTPQAIALALCVVLLAAVSIAPISSVLVAWLGFYCVAGTLSLFGHMASRTVDSRGTVLPSASEVPNAG
jgi:hypothetical protein